MNFWEWLDIGLKQGWVSKPFCYVHEGPDLTPAEEEEVEAFDGEWDVICFPAVRLYEPADNHD